MPQVSIHERGPSRTGLIAQGLGQALGQIGGQIGGQQYRKSQLSSALDQAVSAASQPGVNPLQALAGFLKAGAGIPGSEKYMGQLAPLIMETVRARQSGAGGLAGMDQMEVTPEDIRAQKLSDRYGLEPVQRQQLPGFGEQAQPPSPLNVGTQGAFPSVQMPGESPGNVPQPATEGVVRKVFSPQDVTQEALKLFNQRQKAGIPTTLKEAKEEVLALNEENKAYNAQVESERKARITSQAESGDAAEELLTNIMPDANDEEKAIFRKKGEELRADSKSDADFKRLLAKEAEKFKNSISNIERSLDAPRWHQIKTKLEGKGKSADEAASDMRVLLKPLLDLGLYDKARRLLSSKGFYPEESEKIINELPEQAKSIFNTLPKVSERYSGYKAGGVPIQKPQATPGQLNNLKETISKTLSKNPNASLVLMRRLAEDKGYDWRSFKDSLNEILLEDKIKLTDDQFNQVKHLDTPPLSTLDKILEGLGVIGR